MQIKSKEDQSLHIDMVVLICGASGLVGRDICKRLEDSSIEYIGIHNTRPVKKSHKVNILNPTELSTFLDTHRPSVCVNCVADRNVDACEKDWDLTKKVNTDLVESLVRECSKRNIYFIHISTDYVFDGKTQPSLPSTEPNPLQNYGISKYLAEKRILSSGASYCILRVPVLYTDSYLFLEETAVTQLAKKVFDTTCVHKEDDYSIRRPLFINDLCEFIMNCISEKKVGVYHFYNPLDKTTKYQMIKMIGDYLSKSVDHIVPNITPPSNCAGRPYDTCLEDTSYARLDYPVTSVKEGIAKCFSRFHIPPTESVFYLLDLDGTLIDTDYLHYTCYVKALQFHGIDIDWDTYRKAEDLTVYIQSLLEKTDVSLDTIKQLKLKFLRETPSINYIKGASELLDYFDKRTIQYAVVTNTSEEAVSHFKSILPSLCRVKNWITRRDYTNPKPSPDCYKLALSKFCKDEKYYIGIENTVAGYKALSSLTPHIYIVCEQNSYTHTQLKHKDVYFIKDMDSLHTSVPK